MNEREIELTRMLLRDADKKQYEDFKHDFLLNEAKKWTPRYTETPVPPPPLPASPAAQAAGALPTDVRDLSPAAYRVAKAAMLKSLRMRKAGVTFLVFTLLTGRAGVGA